MLTLGLDGYPKGWVVVALRDGALDGLSTVPTLSAALDRWPGATALGIDIPIGLPADATPRASDLEARALLGARRSSLFLTPPRPALEAPTHAEAIAICRAIGCPAPSAQAYALRNKILEVAPIAAAEERIFEVHPELAFRMLAGEPLAASKRSWNGLAQRRELLASVGLEIPASFPGGGACAADDVLDAAITAWVAWHYAHGTAQSLPAEGEVPHRHHRIWFASP
jgi:predicted RNase H-like nuclease